MSLYHFAFDYKGGSYNSQFEAESLNEAIALWATRELDTISHMNDKDKKHVRVEIADGEEKPTALSTLKNAWYMGFSTRTRMHLLILKVAEE